MFGYKCEYHRRSLMDIHGYTWISNPVQSVGYVPLEARIYPEISMHIHRYPSYLYISAWAKVPDGDHITYSLLFKQMQFFAVVIQWQMNHNETQNLEPLQRNTD